MVLLIRKQDLQQAMSMADCITAIEHAFTDAARGFAVLPDRTTFTIPNDKGWFAVMPAYLSASKTMIAKIVSAYHSNSLRGLPTINALVAVLSGEDGRTLAIIDGKFLTAMRTGATSGVATKYLATKEAKRVLVLGSGVQAQTQLEAISIVRSISEVKVHSPSPTHRQAFAEEMERRIGIEIKPLPAISQGDTSVDIIVTATSSPTPVLNGEWLPMGVHINAIGAHTPETRELDSATVTRSKVVVETMNAAHKEAGDLIIPVEECAFSWSNVYCELAELVTGDKRGRENDQEITLFKSVGIALEDAAAARLAYERCIKEGLGQDLQL